jgi:hypothetical protein
MLVLLTGVIYEVHRWDGLIHTQFHNDRFRNSSSIKGITWTILESVVLLLLIRGILKYVVEMASCSMISIPSFMKTGGTRVQEILRFSVRNFRGCNVGITDGSGLWVSPLRRVRCHDTRYNESNKDWIWNSKVIRVIHIQTARWLHTLSFFFFQGKWAKNYSNEL